MQRMVAEAEQRCGAPRGQALADSGFFSVNNLKAMEQHNIGVALSFAQENYNLVITWLCTRFEYGTSRISGGDAGEGLAQRLIAECAPSCQVLPSRSPTRGARQSSNRYSGS
jgi:hypothetical protein